MPPSNLKFTLVRALRLMRLLPLADTAKYWLALIRMGPANRRFRRAFAGYATPPPALAFDAYNHVSWRRYHDSGLQHASAFARVIGVTLPSGPLQILEWGCGPGRLIRHMSALLVGRPVRLVGTDLNPRSVRWCRSSLTPIEFFTNALYPPLPFADGRFDAVYCFSVFTHLSESAQLAWATELHRVLKPGGVLLCTLHGDAYRYLLADPRERRSYDNGAAVIYGHVVEGRKWFFSITPAAFVRERLLRSFHTVALQPTLPDEAIEQDLWLAMKAPSGQAPPPV